jgi:hypothetical protein
MDGIGEQFGQRPEPCCQHSRRKLHCVYSVWRYSETDVIKSCSRSILVQKLLVVSI